MNLKVLPTADQNVIFTYIRNRETSVIQDDLNLVESLVENVQKMKIEVDPDDPKGKFCIFFMI